MTIDVSSSKDIHRIDVTGPILVLFGFAGLVALWLYPIANLKTRGLVLICLVLVAAGFLVTAWPRRLLRSFALFLLSAITIFLMRPGREAHVQNLQAAVAQSLIRYEGTRYVWGGESKRGIDCSGLIRKGFMNACFRQGFVSLNPRLVREAIDIWWHDCSASELGTGYRGKTMRLMTAGSINELDPAELQTGDLAVTRTGVHVLAYLGDSMWIEADPDLHRVVIVSVPEQQNPWFRFPVQLVRWRLLMQNEHTGSLHEKH